MTLKIQGATLSVEAYPLRTDFTAPGSLIVGSSAQLVFTPVTQADPSGQARCELFGDAGDGEVLLGSWPVIDLRKLGAATEAQARVELPRVDLSPFRGEPVALRWHMTEKFPAGSAAILRPRLLRERKRELPDILFVCSDTHRYDYALGEQGEALMPNLASLSREAVRYTRAYATASWTLPSITSTLTGLYPRHHVTGLRNPELKAELGEEGVAPEGYFGTNLGAGGILLSAYPAQLPTLTERLRGVGYTTAMIVSNGLYTLSGLSVDGQDLILQTGVAHGDVINRAVAGLLGICRGDEPLFLMVHYMDVHQWSPWAYDLEHETPAKPADVEGVREAYSAMVRKTDENLGELLALWQARTPLDESMVVFYSDHGESLFDGKGAGHGNSMAEPLLHVPLVIRYPKGTGVEPGLVGDPVSLVDLYPTVLQMLDAPPGSSQLDGRSLLGELGQPRPFFADYQLYGAELSSLRLGGSKLIIDMDSGEQTLERTEPESATEATSERTLEVLFREYVDESRRRTAGLSSSATVDPELAARALDDLGYFSDED